MKIYRFLLIIASYPLFIFCENSNLKTENEKIIICGCVKNCERFFERSQLDIKNIAKLFKDYRIVIYENNSTDRTKELYESWSKQDQKIFFLSENLDQEYIKNFTPNIGSFRTELIARARNNLLDFVNNNFGEDFRYVIMMDLDGFNPFDSKTLKDVLEKPQYEWDALFANGCYDLYAIIHPLFCERPEIIGWKEFDKISVGIRNKLKEILNKKKWLKVSSAFGGFAIYRREAIRNCQYSGLLNHETLELIFPKDLFKREFFEKKPQKYITKKQKMIDSLKKFCFYNKMENLKYTDPYTCEHINFHSNMIRQGYDKLYIVPNILRISDEHSN